MTAWTISPAVAPLPDVAQREADDAARLARDERLRDRYLAAALPMLPRLWGNIDRNPYRPTYGCLDRQFWHYRTASFPSEMYQEGVLPMALVFAHRLPGNRWYGDERLRELAIAALKFAARSCHRDGSCDDYYPFERALGAAVFSLAACTEAYRLLRLEDAEVIEFFERRARWLMRHDESGHLANHQALAALALERVAMITGDRVFHDAALERVSKVLSWQHEEGWYEEYGGADPGYQTVTIDCLAKWQRMTGCRRTARSLRKAVEFARRFLHDDGSYAGEYGSRGTYHFYPHGMELLAEQSSAAADLADGFLAALGSGRHAYFDDDRLFAHRLGNLIEAWIDWAPQRPAAEDSPATSAEYLPGAQMLIVKRPGQQTIVSAARGGVFKHFADGDLACTDAGLIVQLDDGRIAVSQQHTMQRSVAWAVESADGTNVVSSEPAATDEAATPSNQQPPIDAAWADGTLRFTVAGPLHAARWETATPVKQAVFHLGMVTVGRWCRSLIRRLLQRRLITGRRETPIRLTRQFEFCTYEGQPRLRVVDVIELTSPRVKVARMSYGTDFQSAYVAATGVYQDSARQLWTHLDKECQELNERRQVTIVREFEAAS
jgi:hypothetical protein